MAIPLGLGIVGAGGFARFVVSAAAHLADVDVVAATDTDLGRAHRLAAVATSPRTHAELAIRALMAGRHVFCEKPIALSEADADRVRAAVAASGRSFVVDHVLRYNPILVAMRRLQDDGLLATVHRFSFENDAADEDLPAAHWFWDETISGGILLEHGVHFFDAAALLLGAPPRRVQAIGAHRPDGRTDTVVCTVEHADGALASYAHGFSRPRRAERQLMRVDLGLAEARVYGWIPLRADLEVWADDEAVRRYEALPGRAAQILAMPGARRSGYERIRVTLERDAAPAVTHSRGVTHRAPHHVTARVTLGGPNAKERVYRENVRAALRDLAASAHTGATPRADITAGHAAVRLAVAATAALHDATTHRLPIPEAS